MKKILYLFLILPLVFSSCKKEEGCTDSQATNYNADAEEDDGSCSYSLVGTWNLSKYYYNSVDITASIAVCYLQATASTFYVYTMMIDGTVEESLESYSKSGNTITTIDSQGYVDTWTITKLNGTQLHVYSYDSSNNKYDYRLTKQ